MAVAKGSGSIDGFAAGRWSGKRLYIAARSRALDPQVRSLVGPQAAPLLPGALNPAGEAGEGVSCSRLYESGPWSCTQEPVRIGTDS